MTTTRSLGSSLMGPPTTVAEDEESLVEHSELHDRSTTDENTRLDWPFNLLSSTEAPKVTKEYHRSSSSNSNSNTNNSSKALIPDKDTRPTTMGQDNYTTKDRLNSYGYRHPDRSPVDSAVTSFNEELDSLTRTIDSMLSFRPETGVLASLAAAGSTASLGLASTVRPASSRTLDSSSVYTNQQQQHHHHHHSNDPVRSSPRNSLEPAESKREQHSTHRTPSRYSERSRTTPGATAAPLEAEIDPPPSQHGVSPLRNYFDTSTPAKRAPTSAFHEPIAGMAGSVMSPTPLSRRREHLSTSYNAPSEPQQPPPMETPGYARPTPNANRQFRRPTPPSFPSSRYPPPSSEIIVEAPDLNDLRQTIDDQRRTIQDLEIQNEVLRRKLDLPSQDQTLRQNNNRNNTIATTSSLLSPPTSSQQRQRRNYNIPPREDFEATNYSRREPQPYPDFGSPSYPRETTASYRRPSTTNPRNAPQESPYRSFLSSSPRPMTTPSRTIPSQRPASTDRYAQRTGGGPTRQIQHSTTTPTLTDAVQQVGRTSGLSPGTRFVAELATLMKLEPGHQAPLSIILDRHWDQLQHHFMEEEKR